MKNLTLFFVITALFFSCSTDTEERAAWEGEWNATWETDSTSFAGIDGITHFTMNGSLTFKEEKVTIQANGFEGCAFGEDTLKHTLFWEVKSDSLILTNDEDTPGMSYVIQEKTSDKIRMQLIDDIFLTLQK